MATEEALRIGSEKGLDLVQVAAKADPPVCRLMDYGKFKYQQRKKQQQARKKQRVVQVKEIRLRPKIEKHDLEVKLRRASRFLDDGDKVQFNMFLRGREVVHADLARAVLLKVQEGLEEVARVEQAPKREKYRMIMVLAPDVKKPAKAIRAAPPEKPAEAEAPPEQDARAAASAAPQQEATQDAEAKES